jgi:hypothetical protein
MTKNIKVIKNNSIFNQYHYLSEAKQDFLLNLLFDYQNIYILKKRSNRGYRVIFFFLSLVFFALSIAIFYKSANFTCGLYFGDCSVLKKGVEIACMIFSFSTFGLGCLIKSENFFSRHPLKKNHLDVHPMNCSSF